MGDVDIRQLFDSDPRPTFVVDCDSPSSAIYHVNIALLAIPQIALSLGSHNALRDWWDPVSLSSARHQNEFRHGRYRWAKFVVCHRWLVVTIVQQPPPSLEQPSCFSEPARLSRIVSPLWGSQPDTIFTVKIQSPELRQHIERIRKVDWSKTSLGPISNWGYELNLLVTTLMLETRPTALFLGPERTILYNLAYGAVSGSRHPAILGQSILDAWCVGHHDPGSSFSDNPIGLSLQIPSRQPWTAQNQHALPMFLKRNFTSWSKEMVLLKRSSSCGASSLLSVSATLPACILS